MRDERLKLVLIPHPSSLNTTMSYRHIEQITERRGEKIALFLTAENAAGMMLAALPVYLISSNMPFWLRLIALALAAALGVVATLDVGGMALYERVIWRARGLIRRRLLGRRITPEHLAGAARPARRERVFRAGGPIRIARGIETHPQRVSRTVPDKAMVDDESDSGAADADPSIE